MRLFPVLLLMTVAFLFLASVQAISAQKAFAHSRHLIQPPHGTKSELRARRLREQRAAQAGAPQRATPVRRAALGEKKPYAHVQKRQQKAMATLLDQVGKPYLWGGTSPHTGFDCSGLVYYAYRDLLNIPLPRTANEMYHLQDAPLVDKRHLKRGDLVFFQIHAAQAADHVGVYLGNGKFIQAPRTGANIRISSLDSAFWSDHYLGARRLLTEYTVR